MKEKNCYLITRKISSKSEIKEINIFFCIVKMWEMHVNNWKNSFSCFLKNRRFDNRRKENGMKSKVLLIACQVLRFFIFLYFLPFFTFFSQESLENFVSIITHNRLHIKNKKTKTLEKWKKKSKNCVEKIIEVKSNWMVERIICFVKLQSLYSTSR